MSKAVQMDLQFEEPPRIEAFVKTLKEKKVLDTEIYTMADQVTDHFEEVKTIELILGLLGSDEKAHLTSATVEKPQKKKAEEQRQANQRKTERAKQRKASYPQVFTANGYQRFQLAMAFYTKDDHTPKAKFSNIYHYFNFEGLLICSQLEYIEFVMVECEVRMSKILPATRKYEDHILPLLARITKPKKFE